MALASEPKSLESVEESPAPMTPEDIEKALRREWWINHGHDYLALYGDDGEMWCSGCRPAVDFKRQPMIELRRVVFEQRLIRAAEASEHS
jgi:hypothetical protein